MQVSYDSLTRVIDQGHGLKVIGHGSCDIGHLQRTQAEKYYELHKLVGEILETVKYNAKPHAENDNDKGKKSKI